MELTCGQLATTSTTSTTPTPTIVATRTRLSSGALAGVLVAGLAALFIILALSFLLYRNKSRTQTPLSKHLLDEASIVSATRGPGGPSISYSPNFPENPLHPPIVTTTSAFNPASMPVRRPRAVSPVHGAAMQMENHMSDHPRGQLGQSYGGSERQLHHYSPTPQTDGGDNARSAPVEQVDQTHVRMLAREVAREVIDIISVPGVAENLRASPTRNLGSTNADRDRQSDGLYDSAPSPPSYHLSPS